MKTLQEYIDIRIAWFSPLAGLLLAGGVLAATPASAASAAVAAAAANRTTLAITYPEGASTTVDLVGSSGGVLGRADVKRKDGRTRVTVHLNDLADPRSRGSFYTTYVLWAIAPEGQAESLAELRHSKSVDLDVTTSFQTFGLIVTAEPHSAVRLPSPVVMAENVARDDTKGQLQIGRIEYGGSMGGVSTTAAPELSRRDRNTPALVLGARRAVDLARQAGAERFATGELREAEVKLAALEQTGPHGKKLPRQQEGMARDVMRMAEHARMVAEENKEAARIAAERSTASARLESARSEADRARREADMAHERADLEGKQAAAAMSDAQRERDRSEAAQNEAARAQAGELAARAEAEGARREADEARQARDDLHRQLYQSLSAILETRREARGLIVNLSDVLFDFNRASLTPGAREKLSKLCGVMLAYPGSYRIATEGHTDSIGSDEYNVRLSQERAQSVLGYVRQAGIPQDRLADAVGFGKTRPVASNDAAAGRQMNRRVEIVISGLEQ